MKNALIALMIGLFAWTASAEVTQEEVELVNDVKTVVLEDGRQILAAQNGLTLYTFDVDNASGQSQCFGRCLRVWPALVTAETEVAAPFGITEREPGVFQLMLNNEPLYFFFQDRVEGDILGDGLQGVWHIVEVK